MRVNNHNEIITNILLKPPKTIVLEDLYIKEMSNKETRKEKSYEEKQASKNITEASLRKFRLILTDRIRKYNTKILSAFLDFYDCLF